MDAFVRIHAAHTSGFTMSRIGYIFNKADFLKLELNITTKEKGVNQN